MNKLNLVDNSISRVVFGNTRNLFYDNGMMVSVTLQFLLHNMNNDNFRFYRIYFTRIFNALLVVNII